MLGVLFEVGYSSLSKFGQKLEKNFYFNYNYVFEQLINSSVAMNLCICSFTVPELFNYEEF